MIFLHRLLPFILLVIASESFAVDYMGTVNISEKGESASKDEYLDTVVYFVPNKQLVSESNKSINDIETTEMKMVRKTFSPRVLPVKTGTEVSFPNFDPILHNAFSTSSSNSFDLGFYGAGEQASYTFDKQGLIRVYCNVHHAMVAYILVFDAPFFTVPAANGEFSLKDLPAVEGNLFIWNPRAKPVKEAVDFRKIVDKKTYELALTKRRIPKHSNKDGKSYRRARKEK